MVTPAGGVEEHRRPDQGREYVSRQVDVNDPGSWSDEDRAWLAQRMDLVPQEHRAELSPPVQQVSVVAGTNPQMAKLAAFVRQNYPDRADEDPVDVVISELGGAEVEEESDDYDQWKLDELKDEAKTRPGFASPTGDDAKKKQPWIDALRAWDAEHPTAG